MRSAIRLLRAPTAVLCVVLLAACASDDGYGGYGGDASVAVGYSYYSDGYYPYYGYPPGYGCCWYDNDGRPIEVPPGERPDRPSTLPAGPSQLPAERPNQPSTRPAPSTRPSTGASSRPAPRPTPAPRPMGGGRRR